MLRPPAVLFGFLPGFLLGLLLSLPAAARAAEPAPASAEEKEADARKRCLAGDVTGGMAILAELYVQTRDSIYIHNQARCLQQNGRNAEASLRFREYLRTANDVTAEERARIETYIRELDAQAKGAPLPPVVERAPWPLPKSPSDAPAAVVESTSASSRARTLRIAALSAGAAGLVLIGAGVYFGLRVQSIEESAEKRARDEGIVDRAERDRGQAAARWQWIGYGTGAAALAGGAVAYVLSVRAERQARGSTSLAVIPVVTATGGGGTLRVAF